MTTVRTPLGEVQGSEREGVLRFAGIRYAKPPVGDLRFRPPVPVEPWSGVYDATSFGSSSLQADSAMAGAIGERIQEPSEDCLFLNVFTPSADGARRPVMVWIHGGAYVMGSGNAYNGSSFCTRGDVVVVTINYRLGALGFLPLDHLDPSYAGSANNAILDQVAALRWVQQNIAAFGGDPDNVTIFGESAGGGSVFALLACPAADGLYHRAIAQSAPAGFGPPSEDAASVANAMLDAIGAPDGGVDALLKVDAAEILRAQTAAVGSGMRTIGDDAGSLGGSSLPFRPVVDGVVITRTARDALREKGERNVPLITGTNRDEATLFSYLLPPALTDDQLVAALASEAPDAAALVAAYRARVSGRSVASELFTDAVFRVPTLQAAEAQTETPVPVWVYLFTWATPAFGGALGATHALEIPFVWNTVKRPGWENFVGKDAPVALAEAMHDAWIAFARTGNPNHESLPEWPTYDARRRPTMEFGEVVRVVEDPGADLREPWYVSSA